MAQNRGHQFRCSLYNVSANGLIFPNGKPIQSSSFKFTFADLKPFVTEEIKKNPSPKFKFQKIGWLWSCKDHRQLPKQKLVIELISKKKTVGVASIDCLALITGPIVQELEIKGQDNIVLGVIHFEINIEEYGMPTAWLEFEIKPKSTTIEIHPSLCILFTMIPFGLNIKSKGLPSYKTKTIGETGQIIAIERPIPFDYASIKGLLGVKVLFVVNSDSKKGKKLPLNQAGCIVELKEFLTLKKSQTKSITVNLLKERHSIAELIINARWENLPKMCQMIGGVHHSAKGIIGGSVVPDVVQPRIKGRLALANSGQDRANKLISSKKPEKPEKQIASIEVTEEETQQLIDKMNEEQKSTPLPEGWSEAVDPDGRVFYININSKKTQWDRPVSEDNQNDHQGDVPKFSKPMLPKNTSFFEGFDNENSDLNKKDETSDSNDGWEIIDRGTPENLGKLFENGSTPVTNVDDVESDEDNETFLLQQKEESSSGSDYITSDEEATMSEFSSLKALITNEPSRKEMKASMKSSKRKSADRVNTENTNDPINTALHILKSSVDEKRPKDPDTRDKPASEAPAREFKKESEFKLNDSKSKRKSDTRIKQPTKTGSQGKKAVTTDSKPTTSSPYSKNYKEKFY